MKATKTITAIAATLIATSSLCFGGDFTISKFAEIHNRIINLSDIDYEVKTNAKIKHNHHLQRNMVASKGYDIGVIKVGQVLYFHYEKLSYAVSSQSMLATISALNGQVDMGYNELAYGGQIDDLFDSPTGSTKHIILKSFALVYVVKSDAIIVVAVNKAYAKDLYEVAEKIKSTPDKKANAIAIVNILAINN